MFSACPQEHPALEKEHLLPFSVPMRHHGDDVSFKSLGGRKLVVVSCHPELSPWESLTSRLLSWLIWDDMLIAGRTLLQICEPWAWSWQCALEGVWPDKDHLGREWPSTKQHALRRERARTSLAGEYRFTYNGHVADWAFHHKLYYPFYNGAGHNYCCHRDMASRVVPDLRMENRARDAPWRPTKINNADFKAAVAAQGGHPMINKCPGWHLGLQRTGFMHCGLLGLFSCTSGDLMYDLMLHGHYGPIERSKEALIESAYASLQSYLCGHGRSISHRCFSMATIGSPQKGNYPCLGLKAHDVRMVISWLAWDTGRAADLGTEWGQRRHALAWATWEVCRSIETPRRYVVGPALERVIMAAETWLDLYVSLCYEAKAAGVHRWHLLPKCHQFIHLFEDCQEDFLNPNSFAEWYDEDFMHHTRNMAFGSDRRTVCVSTLMGWWGFVQQNWPNKFRR